MADESEDAKTQAELNARAQVRSGNAQRVVVERLMRPMAEVLCDSPMPMASAVAKPRRSAGECRSAQDPRRCQISFAANIPA